MLSNNVSFSVSPRKCITRNTSRLAKIRRGVVSTLLMSMGLAGAMPVAAGNGKRPVFPAMQFADKARGLEAMQRLGDKLPEVAAWYRMTPEKLANVLRQDENAWLDEKGRLLFIDEFPEAPEYTDTVSQSPSTSTASPYSSEMTFLLHSKPGSKRTIYLDFDGHTTSGTAWSSGTIVAAPFDLNGQANSFDTTEQERIQNIWRRVANDYAPFDVDVTTEEPSADLLYRTSVSDQDYGVRVVITRNNFGMCSGCGGIAYVGVFDFYSASNPGYYQPAWVFFDSLGSGNEKYVAEAISHEAGHNLGLSHDGTSTSNYYGGHNGWAPIMGVGYSQPLVQWSKGEYPDANNHEDDIAVIQANGANLNNDDVGNSMAGAAQLAGSGNGNVFTLDQSGLIETNSDVDYFSLVSGDGPLQITVTPDGLSPNLDASLELLDSAGGRVAYADPADSLSVSLDLTVPAGTYFLKVKGVGKGEPTTTGYSDYGSLGNYIISGSYTISNAIAPDAVASASTTSGYAPLAVDFYSNGSNDSDGIIVEYFWDFNDGVTSIDANPTHTYNSIGTFNPSLTVTDSQGLKSTDSSLTITVTQDPMAATMHIDNIALSYNRKGRNYDCVAEVTIKNSNGGLVSGANVSGLWSGVTSSGTVSTTTDARGVAQFTSPKTWKHGTCSFTVDDVALTGWAYDASQNLETTDSLTY